MKKCYEDICNYENFIYAHSCCTWEQLKLVCHFFFPHRISEVVTHLHHVHSSNFILKYSKKGYSNSEYSSPSLKEKHIKNGSNHRVGQKASENCHKPLWCKIIWRHLDGSQMLEEAWYVELYQLSNLEILEMQLWYALKKDDFLKENLQAGKEFSYLFV